MAIPQFTAGNPLTAAELNVIVTAIDDTAWAAPTLVNSWVNFGGASQVAQYRKVGTEVEIRGTVKSGSAATIFTLPAGFRPPADLHFATVSNGVFGYMAITSAGVVSMNTGTNPYFSLSCRFSTTA